MDELPGNAYKKVKLDCRRPGILRCDWFNKILDRVDMLLSLVSYDDLHDLQFLRSPGQELKMGGQAEYRFKENK